MTGTPIALATDRQLAERRLEGHGWKPLAIVADDGRDDRDAQETE